MRALFMTLLVTAVALAGCASDPLDDTVDQVFEPASWLAGPGSHPYGGLPVTTELPLAGTEIEGWPAGWYQPAGTPLPETITSLVQGANAVEVGSGSGIDIFGSYAFVGAYNSENIWAVDISDMQAPQVIGHLEGASNAGDLDTIAFPPSEEYPDGRLILTASTRSASINIIDATDPSNMTLIATYEPAQGNHNHQVLPGTALVYNAQSGGEGGVNAIWDLSDPENPTHVLDYANGYGCHAIDFFIDASTDRFYGFCAGIEVTQIWDVSDPLAPQVISTMPFPIANQEGPISGGVAPASFSHLAMGNHDGTVLIMGDETGGGAAPGCDVGVRDPITGTALSGPAGNLYFYDISDPADPVLHGSVSPSAFDQKGSCTAHFGGVIEDRDQLVMAFYTVGVVLVNFEDLDNPYVQDIWGRTENEGPCTLCGVWDAQYYRGHVITGDVDRGMDFLSFA